MCIRGWACGHSVDDRKEDSGGGSIEGVVKWIDCRRLVMLLESGWFDDGAVEAGGESVRLADCGNLS